jgi:S1-C subfamily serine protease
VAALVAIAAATGVAFAQTASPAEGTGVVVIKTTLAYQQASAAGTGMVLTSSGEILTNNHVIRGATTIKVVVPGTGRSYTAKVVGYDVADDVAVLQAAGASNLKTVVTASSAPSVGDSVTALGNAGGTGRLTSASGSVTGLRQSIVVSDDQGGTARLSGLIRVNAGVQPGDSGGPLMNSSGEVIGMDTAGSAGATFRSTNATQAYAIPITRALAIAQKVVAGTSSSRIHIGKTAFMGVQVAGGFRGDRAGGAAIAGVTNGGPAAHAGLTPGDVVTAVDGHRVASSDALTTTLLTWKPGDRVTVTYEDPYGSTHSATLTLASGPPQ